MIKVDNLLNIIYTLYMILWFRLILTILRGLWRGRIDVMSPYTTHFRAYPLWDAETNTLNGARFIRFSELATNEVNVRNGFFKMFLNQGVIGLTCNTSVSYLRPVYIFKKIACTAQLLAWDDKYFYRRVQFHQDGELKCELFYRILVKSIKRKKVSPTEILTWMGYESLVSPELPMDIRQRLDYRASKSQ